MADNTGRVVQVHYKDREAVRQSYMHWVKDGGIFFPAPLAQHLGTHVFAIIDMPAGTEGSRQMFAVSGKVAWVGRSGVPSRRGVGIRLTSDESGKALASALEALVAGQMKSPLPTLTM